jgi:hypothetical protein
VLRQRPLCDEQFVGEPGFTFRAGERGTDRVGALGEEPAGLVPVSAPGQAPRSDNPGGPLGERIRPGLWKCAAANQADFFSSVFTFCFASSARAVNATASLTARSARILRSTSTPAALSPWMNRL